jgi:FkbM family methyltransferase
MQRVLKRCLRGVAPGFLKRAIKRRLESRMDDGELREIRLEPAGSAIRCVMGPGWSFLAPEQARADLAYHTNTPQGRAELSGIARIAETTGTLFDIGAHAGLISALFCTAKPANRVFSFEPSPLSQQRLKEIRALNGLADRMAIEPMAIGHARTTMEMLLDPISGFVQGQRFAHSMLAAPEAIQVQVETIGDAAARLRVIPDCLKIDIEGFEYEAILGARDFLARHRPVLLLELHLNYLEEKKASAAAIMEALEGCGYSFFTYGGTALPASDIYDSPLSGLHFLARVA